MYCSGVANVLVLEYTSQVMIVLVILFINTFLSITSSVLTLFEKHHTRSTEAKSLAHKLFLAQVQTSIATIARAAAYLMVQQSRMRYGDAVMSMIVASAQWTHIVAAATAADAVPEQCIVYHHCQCTPAIPEQCHARHGV